jgi:hypothetical protein
MERRASSWFLRSLENRLRLKPAKWQVISSLLVVLRIEAFKGGPIAATHHSALPIIRRLHHIRGFVRSMAEIDFDPAFK